MIFYAQTEAKKEEGKREEQAEESSLDCNQYGNRMSTGEDPKASQLQTATHGRRSPQ